MHLPGALDMKPSQNRVRCRAEASQRLDIQSYVACRDMRDMSDRRYVRASQAVDSELRTGPSIHVWLPFGYLLNSELQICGRDKVTRVASAILFYGRGEHPYPAR